MEYDALLNRLRSEFTLTPINPAAAPTSGIRSSGLPETSSALACLPAGAHSGALEHTRQAEIRARNGDISWLGVPAIDPFVLVPQNLPKSILDRDRELCEEHRRWNEVITPTLYVLDAESVFGLPGPIRERLVDTIDIALANIGRIVVTRRLQLAEYRKWPEPLIALCKTADSGSPGLLFGPNIEADMLFWLEFTSRLPRSGGAQFPTSNPAAARDLRRDGRREIRQTASKPKAVAPVRGSGQPTARGSAATTSHHPN